MDRIQIRFAPPKNDFNRLMDAINQNKFDGKHLFPQQIDNFIKSYTAGTFIALYDGRKPIGFTTYDYDHNNPQIATIRYKWILPEYRGKGIGRQFAKLIYAEFRRSDICCVITQPATIDGHKMARRFAFKPIADSAYMYKVFRHRHPHELTGSGYELLIWNEWIDPYPTEVYTIDDRMRQNPIRTAIGYDAFIEFRKDDRTIISKQKAKYFFTPKELQDATYCSLLFFNTNLTELYGRINNPMR